MDDVAALLERQVTNAASAWRHTKADTEAYRRLVVATDEWETYGTPTLTEDEADRMAAQMRRAARQALVSRDDEAIRLAHLVTVAAAAWLRATPATDAEAYDRLDRAIDEWDAYAAPELDVPAEELLDQLADDSAPVALSEIVVEVSAHFRRSDDR